jgi:hypothetical protein
LVRSRLLWVIAAGAVAACSSAASVKVSVRPLGESVTRAQGFVLTVKAFDRTVDPSQLAGGTTDPGVTFMAVEVEGCVPAVRPHGLSTDLFSADASFFTLMVDGKPVPSQDTSVDLEELQERKGPEDNSFEPPPGQCNGGWVTFEVPTGGHATEVRYKIPESPDSTAWTLT